MINVSPVHRSPDTSLVRCSSRHYFYMLRYKIQPHLPWVPEARGPAKVGAGREKVHLKVRGERSPVCTAWTMVTPSPPHTRQICTRTKVGNMSSRLVSLPPWLDLLIGLIGPTAGP